MRIAVVCSEAPMPRETFLRRDIATLRTRHEVRVFGLARRAPVWRLFPLLRHYPFRAALSLALRLRTAREIADFVADDGFILAHFAWTTADIAAAAAQLSGRPWFCFVHAWDVFTRPAMELRRRTATATGLVACSQAAADACVTAGVDRNRIAVIHHAVASVQSSEFKVQSSEFKLGTENQELRTKNQELSTRPLAVIAVGRLVEKKGFDTLIRAWPAVIHAIPDATLRFVGDGPCAAKLRRLARKVCGKDGSIAFSGALEEEETLRAIADSNMLVLPSRRLPNGDRDGIANVILEAMAFGVPIVTTDAGAAGEVVENAVSGVLLPSPVTPDALAAAIVRVACGDGWGKEKGQPDKSGSHAPMARPLLDRFSAETYLRAIESLLVRGAAHATPRTAIKFNL